MYRFQTFPRVSGYMYRIADKVFVFLNTLESKLHRLHRAMKIQKLRKVEVLNSLWVSVRKLNKDNIFYNKNHNGLTVR